MLHLKYIKSRKARKDNIMTYKEFGENADIAITVNVEVNGEECYSFTTFSTDYLLEYIRPIDLEIKRTLAEQYELLPENYMENE